MTERLKSGYYSCLKLFIADMKRIFANCKTYNEKNTDYHRCAVTLERFFITKMKDAGLWIELNWLLYHIFVCLLHLRQFHVLIYWYGHGVACMIFWFTFQETNEQYLIICLQTVMAFICTHTVRKWTLNFLIGYLHVAIDLFCSLSCTLSVGCTCIIGVRIDVKTVTKSIVW